MAGKLEKLSEKRRKFVEEYVIDLNGTQAAIRAGYSPKNARNTAVKLTHRVDVAEAIKELQEETAEGMNINREDILHSYLEIREKAMKRNTLRIAVQCNDSICKMLGFNMPEKTEITQFEKIEIEIIDEIEDEDNEGLS